MIGAAVVDPQRHFAAVKCRSAKGLFDHYVGAAERVDVTCPCRTADLMSLVKLTPIWITWKNSGSLARSFVQPLARPGLG